MATNPAANCVRMNSCGKRRDIEQINIVMKSLIPEINIEIYNATRGGMLEIFERTDFDSLFEK